MKFRRRAVALATALSLVTLILTIGLALGTVSIMSLNLSRRSYQETRSTDQARSAVCEFIARVKVMQSGQTIQLFNPQPLDLRATFPHTELVEGCWISFDPGESRGYCTDNSGSPQWAQAWEDRGTSKTSLPPYTTELILHSSVGGYQRTYRALLRKVWPYGIYSAGGGLVLTGDSAVDGVPAPPGSGSHVQGDVYVRLGDGPQGSLGNGWTNASTGDTAHIAALSFWQMLGKSFQPVVNSEAPLTLGPDVKTNPNVSFTRRGVDPTAASDPLGLVTVIPPANASQTNSTLAGNTLQGSVFYSDAENRRDLAADIHSGSSLSGSLSYKDPPHDPLRGFTYSGSGDPLPTRPPALVVAYPLAGQYSGSAAIIAEQVIPNDGTPFSRPPIVPPKYVYWGDLSLSQSTRYYVDSSLTNRCVQPEVGIHADPYNPNPGYVPYELTGRLQIDEYGVGMQLNNCVLTINGDLDLSDNGHPLFRGIKGNNATLIVNGTLALSGGSLDAGDQGMVVLAQDVALEGSGTYNGLIIGLRSVSIIPKNGQRFTIHGGIVAGGGDADHPGGIVLRNVDLVQDPRYMKSLNPFGDFQLTGWEAL